MERIYIGLVSTPGFFANMVRRTIEQDYVHVVLGLDRDLNEAYSIGRRHPSIPIISGFEREDKIKILQKFPEAKYMIYELECTSEQKEMITAQLRSDMERRFRLHYAVIGLPFLVLGKEFYQRNHYTCSSYASRVLERCGITLFDKHFSLVTPKDFYEHGKDKAIFEGYLREITPTGVYGVEIG
ncbi:MAG: hypothetical protein IK152_01120 [Lachnospiraceae bacterium]|nr:hypothetical protein [Lachnospiraceae bacterium]